jgi:single-strand DNA-binding protein
LEILSKTYLSLFDCTLWTGIAETTSSYCKKGDLLGIKGRVQTRVYEEEERKRYITEVVAEKVTFLTPKKKED